MIENPAISRGPSAHSDASRPDVSTPTDLLIESVLSVRDRAVPREVQDRAALCVLDLVGVLLAGADTPTARMACAVGVEQFGGDEATVLGVGTRVSAFGAAFINGTAGHALDFDDVNPGAGHPSTVVVPAALAVAEYVRADGPAFIRAVLAGLETQTALGEALGPSHYARGFHTTATLGSFAAAAAACVLLRLDRASLRMAIGLAGTQAAGLKSMFGTDGKPFHAGRAASNGVLAARLAAKGFTSAPDVLGTVQGFADTQSDVPFDGGLILPPMNSRWRTLEVQFKMYASCFLTHASIVALEDLCRGEGLQPDDVEHVEISVPPGHFAVCAIEKPASGLEGKFSLRYTAALALAGRGAGQASFSYQMVNDAELIRLRDRVEPVADPELPLTAARVVVRRRDGSTLSAFHDMRYDLPYNEQLSGRLLAKFQQNVEPRLGPERTRKLAAAIVALPDGGKVGEVVGASLSRDADVDV